MKTNEKKNYQSWNGNIIQSDRRASLVPAINNSSRFLPLLKLLYSDVKSECREILFI